ncbi:carbohydrate kinase [Roseateles sp. BYS180W]|uniref:Carbohydrate kinase n=1 Tax=Roseateles rivi TaxID=3299028 RepID=A0ABW7FSV6_9BURK
MTPAAPLPQLVVLGEALTDLIRVGAQDWKSRCGGAGWNVARAAQALGVSTGFAGAISRDVFGQQLWQASLEAGLDARFLQRTEYAPLLAVVHETAPPRYFFIGDDSADLHFDPAALPQGWQAAVQWAHFGGISLAREPLAARLLEQARALKARGVRISYDPNFRASMGPDYDPMLREMCALAHLIKVSDEDVLGLLRCTDLAQGLQQLRQWAPQALVVCTQGAQGATLWAGRQGWQGRAPEVAVADTVGAGDAFVAALLASLMQQPDAAPELHLRQALAAGALACTQPGAHAPTAQAVVQLAATLPHCQSVPAL